MCGARPEPHTPKSGTRAFQSFRRLRHTVWLGPHPVNAAFRFLRQPEVFILDTQHPTSSDAAFNEVQHA
eukprot:280187-Rhodomonas_salina.2